MCMVEKSKKIFVKCDFRYRDNKENLCIKVFFEVYLLSNYLALRYKHFSSCVQAEKGFLV